ncbi:hypothetical protein PJP10_32250, partial [Mycobacterium kansasii]
MAAVKATLATQLSEATTTIPSNKAATIKEYKASKEQADKVEVIYNCGYEHYMRISGVYVTPRTFPYSGVTMKSTSVSM